LALVGERERQRERERERERGRGTSRPEERRKGRKSINKLA
jgi:hypothetical protein